MVLYIGVHGLEGCCQRTAEQFAISDYENWTCDIRHIVHMDWLEMREMLMNTITDHGRFTKDRLNRLCDIWEMGGARLNG